MGRQNRRESPHAGLSPAKGTVQKATFDVLGRTVTRSVGTDETGTGSDNMTVTELLEYDGNAVDGNSLLIDSPNSPWSCRSQNTHCPSAPRSDALTPSPDSIANRR